MLNSRLLKSIILKNGFTQQDVAKKIGCSVQSFNAKINGKIEFKISEVMLLCNLLNIGKEKEEIFFAKKIDL